MTKNLMRLSVLATALVFTIGFVGLTAGNATAQMVTPSEPGAFTPALQALSGDEYDPTRSDAPSWGAGVSAFQIPASEFTTKQGSTVQTYLNTGYISKSAGGSQFWAPIILPAGCDLDGIRLFYYDNSASNITAWFTRYHGSSTPGAQDLVSWNSAGTPGFTSTYIVVGEDITYSDSTDGEQAYALLISIGTTDGSLRFKGARLTYYLQVSPAPGTATFSDVPVGAFGFQHIEALAASGITAGCGGGNFCPDDPLNRAQMAVFLSKALGLHFMW